MITARQLKNNTEVVLYTAAHYHDVASENVSGTTSWDITAKPSRILTLTGNITLSNPSNKDSIQTGVLIIKQDGSGGHTVTWDTDFSGMNGDAIPSIDTAASAVTILFYVCDGTSVYVR